jgi:hypothetical protein
LRRRLVARPFLLVRALWDTWVCFGLGMPIASACGGGLRRVLVNGFLILQSERVLGQSGFRQAGNVLRDPMELVNRLGSFHFVGSWAIRKEKSPAAERIPVPGSSDYLGCRRFGYL